MTRGELVRSLASTLGVSHEARFIADEVHEGASGELTEAQVARAWALAERRAAGEPLQYVLGHWAFRTLDLLVDRRVLIPRPETEQVVEVALGEARRMAAGERLVAVDAGTGSGAIALSLAVELKDRDVDVYATDVSAAALDVARANLARVRGLSGEVSVDVTFVEGSWLDCLPERLRGQLDLVVSNPPYVAEDEWPGLSAEVRAEPRGALVADDGSDGTPGLADIEAVLAQAAARLAPSGAVVLELAPPQAQAAGRAAERLGFEVEVRPDLSARPRALVARRV